MARQNVQFKGLRHTPSDITGQDGDLLECVNLIHENVELKPLEMPAKTQIKGVWDNEVLVAVHNITDGKKFVFAVWNGVVSYIHIKTEDNGGETIFTYGIPNEEIKWAETIGNTLIIGTDKSTHYALYKNGQYKWLGDKLPQPVFEFYICTLDDTTNNKYYNIYKPNITGKWKDGNNYVDLAGGGVPLRVDMSESPTYYVELRWETEENKTAIRDNLRAKMAEILNKSKKDSRFIYPFLVRYAVRLFDGSHVMHSAPLLMLPSTIYCPIAAYLSVNYSDDVGGYSGYYGNLGLAYWARGLKYKFNGFVDDSGNGADINDWEDIVKGVDIGLSSQFVTFRDDFYDDIENVPIRWYWHETGSIHYDYTKIPDYGYCYANNSKTAILDIYKSGDIFPSSNVPDYSNACFPLESKSAEYTMERIKSESLFYRVKNYDVNKLNEIKDKYVYLNNEIEYGTLERLETLPLLEDDYVSRCRMVGSVNYNYNQRLILGNISLQAPLWYQDAKQFEKTNYNVSLMFRIDKPEKTIWVKWAFNRLGQLDFGHYIFYPDPDCKEVVFIINGSNWRSVPMHEHTGLHGAYALMPELQSLYEARMSFSVPQYSSLPYDSTDRYYQLPNTIAMSSVANPFHFPATNFKDIGRAKVIGIAANMLDVSSAQWGQYPLYVFCSDGIIAVMIDGEGKFGGIQAVSADVLIEPRGLSQPTLIQTGQALMFLTKRGVMAVAGIKISCLSDAVKGRHSNLMRELSDLDYHVGAFQNLISRTSDDIPFSYFAEGGFLAYDYAHNRVLLLRDNKDYQYVYSIGTGLWSKQIVYTNLPSFQLTEIPDNELPLQRDTPLLKVKPIRAAVNNYTEMYLQDTEGWLYKTMDVQDENNVKQVYQYGYLVSRPVRFGTDEYKTLVRTLHRYTHYANMSFVKMAVYGSRDGVKYGRLNTLRGMSYKYFIFAIYTYLKPNERYSYLSVDFETRLSNKLR
jgi:hypothetical protein